MWQAQKAQRRWANGFAGQLPQNAESCIWQGPGCVAAIGQSCGPCAQCILIAQLHRRCIQAFCCTADALQASPEPMPVTHRRCIHAPPGAAAGRACLALSAYASEPSAADGFNHSAAPLMLHQGSSLRRKGIRARPRAQSTHDPALRRTCSCVRDARLLAWLHCGCTQAAPSTTDAFGHVQCFSA